MENYSVTVRDNATGVTHHIPDIAGRNGANAAFQASGTAFPVNWMPGSAPIEFYQLDPELDSFSYGYYSTLEDAQADGLRWYREHSAIISAPTGELSYAQHVEYPADHDSDVPSLESWSIVDDAHPGLHISMFHIVKCSLWTSRQTSDSEPLPEAFRKPGS